MKAKRQYVPPHRYTAIELVQRDIADLESDVRCALRDGQPEYAAECEARLTYKRAELAGILAVGG